MNYEIDKKTLLFVNLTSESFAELEALARGCMIGRVDLKHPAFELWVNVSGENSQLLLTYSISFVQHVLLSLLDYLKAQK